jgi:DNA-binding transcriptional LysR family regulator
MPIRPDPLTHRLESRLKMRHYALLLAFDRLRSVTRVAEQMSLSQPTVTRALADIEDIFMAPLFVRTGRGLEPTAAGEVVIARARFAIADNDALRMELEGVRAGRQGRLRLGVIPYVSGPALDAAWRHLFAIRPRVALHAHEDTSLNLIAALRNRSLDCAICRFTSDTGDVDLVQELLYHQQAHLVVATPSAAPIARRKNLDMTDLADMDWIFPPENTPIRQLIETTFASVGQRAPVPLMEAYAVRTIAHALSNLPRGITVLPRDVAQSVADTGAARMLQQPLAWQLPPVGLAWLRASPKSEMATQLAAAMRQVP